MIDFTAEEVYVTGGKDVIVGEKLFLVFIGHFFAYDWVLQYKTLHLT